MRTDCATRLEDHLRKLPGMLACTVNSLTHKTDVRFDDAQLSERALLDQISSAGFSGRVISRGALSRLLLAVSRVPATLPVPNALEQLSTALRGVAGISSVATSTAAVDKSHQKQRKNQPPQWLKQMEVEFDAALIGPRAVLAAAQERGQSLALAAALANDDAAAHDSTAADLIVWRTRFLLSLVLAVPVILLAYILPASANGEDVQLTRGLSLQTLLLFLLATPAQLFIARPLYLSAWAALRSDCTGNVDSLIVLSTTVAYVYSICAVIVTMAGTSVQSTRRACLSLLLTFNCDRRWLVL